MSFGATFDIPVSPYRAEGWLTLRHQFEALTPDARAVVRGRLGGETAFDVQAPVVRAHPPVPGRSVANRHWR